MHLTRVHAVEIAARRVRDATYVGYQEIRDAIKLLRTLVAELAKEAGVDESVRPRRLR